MASALPPPEPLTPGLPDLRILVGQLAPASIAGYRHDLAAYLRYCGEPAHATEAASLARWRVHMAQDTRLSPHTINRRLAAVKRLVAAAAEQGYLDTTTAAA